MSVLVVGSVALDSVETPAGKVDEAVGGSATFFSASASYFTSVNLVGVVGTDYPMDEIDFLKSRGVDFSGLQIAEGLTFRWAGKYNQDFSERETLYTHLNVFSSFRPHIPEKYKNSQYVFLGNIAPELQASVLDQVQKPKCVVLDSMNFWITGSLEALKLVLRRVDLFMLNDSEARLLTGESHLIRAARQIIRMGPKAVVIKKGEHGAALITETMIFMVPAYPIEQVCDPTGAGDTFAGGFVGYLAQNGDLSEPNLRRAVVYGSAMASFCVEDFSIRALRSLTLQQIRERVRTFQAITQFEIP